jgi:hypothetical protein
MGFFNESSASNEPVSFNDLTDKPTTYPPTTGFTTGTAKPGEWVPQWNDVQSKPTTFTPSAHTHTASQITDFATAVSSNSTVTGKLTATQIPYIDPATATPQQIAQALIDAGIMTGA